MLTQHQLIASQEEDPCKHGGPMDQDGNPKGFGYDVAVPTGNAQQSYDHQKRRIEKKHFSFGSIGEST